MELRMQKYINKQLNTKSFLILFKKSYIKPMVGYRIGILYTFAIIKT